MRSFFVLRIQYMNCRIELLCEHLIGGVILGLFKRFKRQFITLFVICLVAGFGLVKRTAATVSASPVTCKTVIIDPGHPGLANTIDLVRKLP